MSGTRRTEDLHSAKVRQFIFQNPDGSFPLQGAVMAAADSRGSIVPTRDIVVDSVTTDTIIVTGTIVQENLNVGTLTVTSGADISGELTVTGGNIILTNGTLFAPNIIVDSSVTTQALFADTIDCSGSLTTQSFTSTSVNATDINASTAIFTDLSVNNLASIFNIETTSLEATNIITTPLLNVDNSGNGIATINGTLTVNGPLNIPAGSATINGPLTITGSSPITATNAIITNLTSTSISAIDISAQQIRATDISTNYIWAATAYIASQNVGSYNFTDLSAINIDAQTIDVSSINVTGVLNTTSINISDISANLITTNDLISTVVETSTINLNGTTTTGVMTYNDISDISGLFINGVSVVNMLYPAVPFPEAAIINNLSTVSDIAATLLALINSYNLFLNNFSGRGIIVNVEPSILLFSPLSVQFIVKGVAKPPLILNAPSYVVGTLMTLLTTYGQDSSGNQVITFSATKNPSTLKWVVTITNSDLSGTTYITDVTGMPTGSLQLLRYLGFTLGLFDTRFESYSLAGSQYTRTGYPLAASNISDIPFSESEQFPNTIPTPVYTLSGDPYSLPITFTNMSGIASGLVAVSANSNYILYPPTNPNITVLGLQPITPYTVLLTYLDNRNSDTVSTILTTTKIPAPTVSVSGITFNRFTLTWPQPYPGRTYKFMLTGPIGETTWTPVLGTGVVKSTTVPSRFTRTSGSFGYTNMPTTSSNCDLSGGGYVSFSDISNITCIVGLTVDLSASMYTGYGFYITAAGEVRYIQGNSVYSTILDTYNSTTEFMIVYDGNYVGFYINGVNRQTVQNTLIGALRLDLKFASTNIPINNLVVAPLLSSAFTCRPLLQNSPYTITLYSFDQQSNQAVNLQQKYVSDSIDVVTSTLPLNVPTPSIVDISNTNIAKRIQWSPATTSDVSGTLYYEVNGAGSSSYSIPTGVSSFNITTGITGTGDISCSLYYTDNYYNSVYGSSVDASFNTAFGFRDLSANAVSPLILDNVGITRGVGYMFPAIAAGASIDSPWLGYTVNKISFPQGISEISGTTMTLNINVYDVSGASLSPLYASPSASVPLTLSLYPVIASINSVDISANTTALVNTDISFNNSFTLTKNTIIMYSVGPGAGRLRFRTFNISTPPNNVILPNIRDLATAVTYNSSTILSNGFRLTETGSLCEFSYV